MSGNVHVCVPESSKTFESENVFLYSSIVQRVLGCARAHCLHTSTCLTATCTYRYGVSYIISSKIKIIQTNKLSHNLQYF
jgi:hypothetical protein